MKGGEMVFRTTHQPGPAQQRLVYRADIPAASCTGTGDPRHPEVGGTPEGMPKPWDCVLWAVP